MTWSYVVTNTGNVALRDVVVRDDNGTPSIPGDDFTVGTIASLAAGAAQTLTWNTTATATGQYGNVGSVSGLPVDNNGNPIPNAPRPTDSNPDYYYGVQPAIHIVKLTNGTNNDSAHRPVHQSRRSGDLELRRHQQRQRGLAGHRSP